MSGLRNNTRFGGFMLSGSALIFGVLVRAQSPQAADGKRTLAELVGLALQNTQILGSQDARIEETRLAASQARVWPGSTLDASGGRKQEGSLSGPRYELAFVQPLPLLGKPGLRGGLLDLESEVWRVRRAAMELDVSLSVIQSGYEYAVNRRKAGFVERRQKRFELIRDYLAGREFATPQKKAESRIVRNRLNSLVSDAILSQAGFKASLEKLKVYVPLEPGTYPDIEVPWLSGTKTLNEEEWRTKVLEKNPDLLLQKLSVKSADLERRLASREGLPEPAIGASYEEAKAAETEKNFGLGLSLDLPPWNRNRSGIRSAEQRKIAEERQLAFEEQKLKADLPRLLVEYEAARRVARQYPETLLSELEAQLRDVEAGFRKGQVDLLTFLELDGSVSETFDRVLDAQRELAAAWAALMATVGERDALAQLGLY